MEIVLLALVALVIIGGGVFLAVFGACWVIWALFVAFWPPDRPQKGGFRP